MPETLVTVTVEGDTVFAGVYDEADGSVLVMQDHEPVAEIDDDAQSITVSLNAPDADVMADDG